LYELLGNPITYLIEPPVPLIHKSKLRIYTKVVL
jgi:hypothetical protein